MRKSLKAHTPPQFWYSASSVWHALTRALQWPSATLHPLRRASIRKLKGLKDKHQGERCFIIGNGPSLKDTDLSSLQDERTFGLNRIYLLFPELGFTTTYFISVNDLVVQQCADEIRMLPVPKFLSWRARKLIQPTPDTVFLHTTYTGPRFSRDARGRLWEGATVTYVTLQLAFHMGFSQIILIGVDHNFSTDGKPNTTIISQGDDIDHFHPAYFGKGFRWQLPDLATSERGYQLAHEAFLHAGREVLDATIGGKLQIFPKVDYSSLF